MKNQYVSSSSVPLCQLDDKNLPIAIASGCIVYYKERRLLLTVEHATGNQGNWAIELEYDKDNGCKLYRMGAMNFVKKFSLPTNEGTKLDFSYVEIPDTVKAYRHILTSNGETISKEEIHTYNTKLCNLPNKDDEYAFSGYVMPQYLPNPLKPEHKILERIFNCFNGLKFIRQEQEISVFKLPFNHPGHEHFQGCSGSPIINSQNEPVALLCEGNSLTNEIFGISLKHMQPIIEASV
ncbi:MAG: hypothetical protein PHV82_10585 [Victivallaceae bacterium]|nr:hypothetical protein [Victivallaceae bacterium]